MDWLLFGLLLFGLILSIVGYLLDHVMHLPWLLERLAPEYLMGMRALDHIAEQEHNALHAQHPGFPILWERWPTPNVEKKRVAAVGRGPAYVQLLHNVRSDINLFLADENRNVIGQPWSYTEAKAALSEEMDRNLFKIGSTVFSIGIAVSLFSALASLISSLLSTNGQPRQSAGPETTLFSDLSNHHPIDRGLAEFLFNLIFYCCQ